MKNIYSIQWLQIVIMLFMLMGLNVGCATRFGPAYVTATSFAGLPKQPPIVAVPLPQNTLGIQSNRGLRLTLDSVLFETNKASLRSEGQRKIKEFAKVIEQYGETRQIIIEGHTDSQGGEVYNQRLSEQRAKTVRHVLTKQKINPKRLTTKGFGEKKPIATNANRTGRQQNRRVEILILNKGETP